MMLYQKKYLLLINGFEAYNKKIMYGSDVISVLNKAIDNNTKYQSRITNGETNLRINVSVIIHKDIGLREEFYIQKSSGSGFELDRQTLQKVFKEGNTYSLYNDDGTRKDYDRLQNVLINIRSIASEDDPTVSIANARDSGIRTNLPDVGGREYYKITYYPQAEFKRATYKCTNMSYDNVTGRLNSMTFEQIRMNEF